MKISLEYDEVIQMLSRELGRPISEQDITITQEPFSIEISGLDFEELMQIRNARSQATPAVRPVHQESYPEPEAERPMVPVSEESSGTAEEIAGLLSENLRLSQSEGGAGPVPRDPHNIPDTSVETPEDFLPPGATYDPPGEMAPEEIRGRR